jgi:hypothetical protein
MDSDADLVGNGMVQCQSSMARRSLSPSGCKCLADMWQAKALLKLTTSGLPATQATRGSTDAKKKRNALAVKQNAIAIAALALAFQDSDTSVSYIQESMDDEWWCGR